ncbi:hypothetical protein H310_04146 [Aphanomyces invadans]|uniref:Phosphatidate phosphatase APP1 catalytic domain-containing protein n=3 Tax=Aphanomyces invadans TaxID=157072 RepID=A0A024UFR8_9STRA|nr:hypothetical protein H310_04146 [Aphanomyces invadans]ETW05129.1 hypothetical protein H310_04146 [Aphanomyces invadans]|eukprot:XP_008866569.1 hypothetical protein H310_04146 [Aphanomyces invadans]
MAAPAKLRKFNMGIIVLVLALLLTMVVAFVFLAFFSFAPVLCACCVGILYVIGLYLGFESKAWHHAQEFENRFWTVMAFLFSTALFYSKDSPFAIGRYSTSLGCVLVIAFTLAVQFLDRHIHREQLANQGRITRSQLPLATKDINLAHTKTSIIAQCVASVDPIYLPSTINLIVNGDAVKGQEQRVLDILMKAEKTELNYILGHIQLALLFYKVKDPCRTHICQLLCETRVMELTVNSRAIVLDALMLMKLSAHAKGELWAKNILLRTTGDDLSILKSTTDSKGTIHTMHQLVYHDIRSDSVRTAVLNHIQRQARFQLAHMQISTKNIGGKRKQLEWRKVLSDVDDTLESSGGMWPAGVDRSYPRHTVYPGVLAFYRELDLGPNAPSSTWEPGRLGNLTFISARPHVYKDLSEKKSIKKFDRLHSTRGLHCLPSMLAGSVASGTAFVVKGDLEPMALKKFENFREYYAIYPEYKHIFIGDNGQGDVRAAQLIADTYGPSVLEAGYFHLVQPLESTHGFVDKDTYKRQNIFFFETYVGAAVRAYRMHQISKRGLHQVAEEASATFLAMQWKPHDADRRELNRIKLNADFALANEILQEQSVPLIGKPQKYDVGTCMETPFGNGMLVAYNAVTGIYSVDLIEWWSRSGHTKVYLPEDSLSNAKRPLNDFSLATVAISIQHSHNPASYVRTSMVSSMDPLLLSQGVVPLRTAVSTPFGPGVVLAYRPDHIYVIQLSTLNRKAHCQRDHVRALVVPQDNTPSPSSSSRSFVRSSIGYIAKKLKVGFMTSPSQGPTLSSPVLGIDSPELMALEATTAPFPTHSRVLTPFGVAVVVAFKAPVYEVHLVDTALASAKVAVQQAHVSLLSTPHPDHHPLPVQSLVVAAPFGYGRVRRFRSKDSIYEVEFVQNRHGMVGFIHASKVAPVQQPTPRRWNVQTRVQTPFGPGVVAVETNERGVVGVTLSAASLHQSKVFVQADALVEELEVKPSLGLLSRLRRSTMWFESKPHDAATAMLPVNPPAVHPKLGKPVRTLWGPGILTAVRPTDNVHIVMFKTGMQAFLVAGSVGEVVQAAMGEVVKTPYGKGVVLTYHPTRTGVFIVQFSFGIGYIQARDLERLPDRDPPASCAIM